MSTDFPMTRRQIEMRDSWEGEDPLAPSEDVVEKVKYPAAEAIEVARELVTVLAPVCGLDRLKVCGSLRRRKKMVGDVEMVFVPQVVCSQAERTDLFGTVETPAVYVSAAGRVLDDLVTRGVLAQRLKCDGSRTWGQFNRLAVHVASGIPVDFFACEEIAWWNTVVSRTGGAQSNTEVARAAIRKGWHWEPGPTSPGFQRRQGMGWEKHPVTCEEDVFQFVGMPFLRPEERR